MNRLTRLAACAAVLAAAAGASAHGVTPQSEDLELAAQVVSDAVANDVTRAKSARKVLSFLRRKSNTRSLADELRSVSSAARLAQAKVPLLLDAALTDAAAAYEADLASTRELLALATTSSVAPKKDRVRWLSALARFDRALPPGLPPVALTERFSHYAAAAAAGKGFTPYDAGATYDWVISLLALAPAGQGADLDDDGTPDNAVGGLRTLAKLLGVDLDALFADTLSQGTGFQLIEMWSVQKLSGDSFVLAGMLTATDGDLDSSNDFSGSGVFSVASDTLDAHRHPAGRVVTACGKRGAYTIDLTSQGVDLQGFVLPAGTKVVVQGNAAPAANDGVIGVAIPMDVLFAAIEAGGTSLSDSVKSQIRGFADIDTDPGTPGREAISAAFAFTAVSASTIVGP